MNKKTQRFFYILAVLAVITCSVACENLWNVNKTASISFDVKSLDGFLAKQDSLGLNNARSGAFATVTVDIVSAGTDSVFISKTVPYSGGDIIVFEELPIVGKTVYARLSLVSDDGHFIGVSQSAQMVAGKNYLLVENLTWVEEDDDGSDDDTDIPDGEEVYLDPSASVDGDGTLASPFSTLQVAIDTLNADGSVDGDIILVKTQVTMLGSDYTALNDSRGLIIKRADGNTGVMLLVDTDIALNFNGITIDGNGIEATSNLVRITDGDVFIGPGSVVKNGISNNAGAAIGVSGTGNVILDGGIIQNNSASGKGAISVSGSATFTMNSGSIINNVYNTTGGQTDRGGGVSVTGGTFNLKGGSITNNTSEGAAGGITLSDPGRLVLFGIDPIFVENNTKNIVFDIVSSPISINNDSENNNGILQSGSRIGLDPLAVASDDNLVNTNKANNNKNFFFVGSGNLGENLTWGASEIIYE